VHVDIAPLVASLAAGRAVAAGDATDRRRRATATTTGVRGPVISEYGRAT
jgi:hypothetical protein